MKTLLQKSWVEKIEITLLEDGIFFKNTTLRFTSEYKIRFEDVGFEVIRSKDKVSKYPVILFFSHYILGALFFLAVFIFSFFFLKESVIGTIFSQLFWGLGFIILTNRWLKEVESFINDKVIIFGERINLEFFGSKPDKVTVDSFISEIHKSMRIYFKHKFTNLDTGLPLDYKVMVFEWLKENKIISDVEYDDYFLNLNRQNTIGFKKNV